MAQHNEIEFEKELAEYLAAHGWLYSPNDAATTANAPCFPRTSSAGWPTPSLSSWRRSSSRAPATSPNSRPSCWTGS